MAIQSEQAGASVRKIADLGTDGDIEYAVAGQEPKRVAKSFFRGSQCNFNPQKADFDRPTFLASFLLKGWMPKLPVISRATKVTAFGSCFAEHITNHLAALGYDLSKHRAPAIYISRMGDGMVNTYAILQQFEWALDNRGPLENLWHGYRCEEFGYDEDIRKATQQVFLETELFIITLGLSEIWYDEPTGGIFWRAVPLEVYDSSRHKFRVCSFEETKQNISRIYDLIRAHVPGAKVVFTVSPIPLAATFRPIGCITANSASKAILRAALDEFYRERESDLNETLFYFPSFEIVNELFFDRFREDFRHPHEHIIGFVTKLFEAVYCEDGSRLAEADSLLAEARKLNRNPNERVSRTIGNLIRFLRGELTTCRPL